MYELAIQSRARRDLREIWRYTFEKWNETQADAYVFGLYNALLKLKRNPKLGRQRWELGANYRSLAINRHVVFYTVDESVVRVIRLLHGRMDPDEHL